MTVRWRVEVEFQTDVDFSRGSLCSALKKQLEAAPLDKNTAQPLLKNVTVTYVHSATRWQEKP